MYDAKYRVVLHECYSFACYRSSSCLFLATFVCAKHTLLFLFYRIIRHIYWPLCEMNMSRSVRSMHTTAEMVCRFLSLLANFVESMGKSEWRKKTRKICVTNNNKPQPGHIVCVRWTKTTTIMKMTTTTTATKTTATTATKQVTVASTIENNRSGRRQKQSNKKKFFISPMSRTLKRCTDLFDFRQCLCAFSYTRNSITRTWGALPLHAWKICMYPLMYWWRLLFIQLILPVSLSPPLFVIQNDFLNLSCAVNSLRFAYAGQNKK